MTDVLTLVLPMPPNRGNARENRYVTQKRKKAYYAAAAVALHSQFAGKLEGWPGRATMTATLYTYNKMDWDGRCARMKWPQDAMVRYGLLIDDSDEYLTVNEVPKGAIDRKSPRIVITLTATREAA